MTKEEKQNLMEEKMKLVWQLNVVQERIEEYWIVDIAIDNWTFKDEANLKKRIEMRIKEINNLLDSME